MADNLKKVKRDRGRIALTQLHEMQYIKKIAREIVKEELGLIYLYSPYKIQRLARAFLKLSKKKRR